MTARHVTEVVRELEALVGGTSADIAEWYGGELTGDESLVVGTVLLRLLGRLQRATLADATEGARERRRAARQALREARGHCFRVLEGGRVSADGGQRCS